MNARLSAISRAMQHVPKRLLMTFLFHCARLRPLAKMLDLPNVSIAKRPSRITGNEQLSLPIHRSRHRSAPYPEAQAGDPACLAPGNFSLHWPLGPYTSNMKYRNAQTPSVRKRTEALQALVARRISCPQKPQSAVVNRMICECAPNVSGAFRAPRPARYKTGVDSINHPRGYVAWLRLILLFA